MASFRSIPSLANKMLSNMPKGRARVLIQCSATRALSTRPQLQQWDDGGTEQAAATFGSYMNDPTILFDPPALRPYAKNSPQFKFPTATKKQQRTMVESKLSMGDFIQRLPQTLRYRQKKLANDPTVFDSQEDPIDALFRQMQLSYTDWAPYAHFDPTKAYARNLIATDNETFTLLLLCWNANAESKIHDHPCDGCWLNVLQGQVQETRYIEREHGKDGKCHLECVADETFVQGQLAFINDSIGLHKVGNPSKVIPAVTLHLYAPPFSDCQVWVQDDDDNAKCSVSQSSCATHYSEFGRIL